METIINFFRKLFSKKPTEKNPPVLNTPVETPENKPTHPVNGSNKKIAILVGHGAGDSGAMCFNGMAEHEYNKQVAGIIKLNMPNVEVFFKSSVGGWAPVYAKLAVYRPDLSVELHLNAYNGKAVGCEVLITNENARSIGEKFASDFCTNFKRVKRATKGIKFLKSGDRGFGNVYSASKVSKKSILVEPFFCDTPSEWLPVEVYASFLVGFLKEV